MPTPAPPATPATPSPTPPTRVTTPPPPTATPLPVATPPSPPKKVNKGKMTFQLKKLAEPLELEQDTIDPKWNKFKTYFGVCVGGFCFMAWIVYLSFQWGRVGQTIPASVAIQQPVTVAVPQLQPIHPTPSGEPNTAEEREKRFKEYLRNQDR